MCFTTWIIFFYIISNSDLLTLCVMQHFAGAKFCWFPKLCVAMVRFMVCLCMLGYYTGLATPTLCVLRFAQIAFGANVVASFGLLNFCKFMQVSIFAGWTSFTLSRFVFSFVCLCIGIVLALLFVFCVFRCLNIFFH